MQDTATVPPAPRSLPLRVLFMSLMCVAFQVTAWVLVLGALAQLVPSSWPGSRCRG